MSGIDVLRADIVPFGNCVISGNSPDAIPQEFANIDGGVSDPALLDLAQRACGTCIQLVECRNQRGPFAEELWRRGAGLVMAGGEQVLIDASQVVADGEIATLMWNNEIIPTDPDNALNIMRQGIRANIFRLVGKTPATAGWVAQEFMGRLAEDSPRLHEQVVAELAGDAHVGLSLMITAMFQQKDYANHMARKQSHNTGRYDRSRFDLEADGPILRRLAEDMLEIKSMGYSLVGNKAIVFPPSYLAMLKRKFYKPDEISWNDFSQVVNNNRRDPFRALERRYGLHYRARQANRDAPEGYSRVAARIGRGGDAGFSERVDDIFERHRDKEYVTKGVIRGAVMTSPGSAEAVVERFVGHVEAGLLIYGADDAFVSPPDIYGLAKRYRDDEKFGRALIKFGQNMRALKGLYAGNPNFPDTNMRELCDSYMDISPESMKPEGADRAVLDAAKDYEKRVAQLVADSDGSVPLYFICRIATNKNCPATFPEVFAAYQNKLMVGRLKKFKTIERPITGRMMALYPEHAIESVAGTVSALLEDGLLTVAQGDVAEARDGNWQSDLEKIFDPKSEKYLTFSAALEGLSDKERLAIACRYGIMPLIYGRSQNIIQIEQLLACSPLEGYCTDVLYPRCQALIANSLDVPGPQGHIPIHRLSSDIAELQQFLGENSGPRDVTSALTISGLRRAIVVVGSRILQLAEQGSFDRYAVLSEDQNDWLNAKVAGSYPPNTQLQHLALRSARDALEKGILELLGNSTTEYRLSFTKSFYLETSTDIDRALIAHELGLDRLLYGSDLRGVLRSRLGVEPRSIILARSESPIITDISPDPKHKDAERLHRDYYGQLFAFATQFAGHGIDLESLVSNAIMTAAYEYDLSTVTHLRGFLMQLVSNMGRSEWRKLQKTTRGEHYTRMVSLDETNLTAQSPAAHEDALRNVQYEELRTLLASDLLPQRQREVIYWRYFAGLDEAETASKMGISRGAAKSHMARAMARLRGIMTGRYSEGMEEQ